VPNVTIDDIQKKFEVSAERANVLLAGAAERGDVEDVRKILKIGGADPEKVDEHWGLSPFMLACSAGHVEVVRVLLEHVLGRPVPMSELEDLLENMGLSSYFA